MNLKNADYDIIIVGAGSAGYPAGMYASRYKLKNLIIGEIPGGALGTSHKVENFPGIISSTGMEIMNSFKNHAEVSGSEILQEKVVEINFENDLFVVKTSSGKTFTAVFVILATGNKYKELGLPEEKSYIGKGLSYCATCDGMFFKKREIAIVGGGDKALTEGLYLSEIAKKVYIIHRKSEFRAEKIWVEKAKNTENIEFILEDEVEKIIGEPFMESVTLKSGKTLNVEGLFVAIGSQPYTELVKKFDLKTDTDGTIFVDKRQETSFKRLFAAGDVTTNSNKFRQTIMSAAEGCLAADSIHEDFLKLKN